MSIARLQTGRACPSRNSQPNVYLAQVLGAKGAPDGQVKDILSRIETLLAEAKTDKSKILSATIWLTDMSAFGK